MCLSSCVFVVQSGALHGCFWDSGWALRDYVYYCRDGVVAGRVQERNVRDDGRRRPGEVSRRSDDHVGGRGGEL